MPKSTSPIFGPTKPSRLNLMGIRFLNEGGDGAGAGGGDAGGGEGDFTPPATQAEFDAILNKVAARTHKQYEGFVKPEAAKPEAKTEGVQTPEAIAEAAREEGRSEARAELAIERVNDALKASLSGRALDPAVLVLGFDKKQFVKDGSADAEAIKQWIEANSTEIKTGNGRDPGQGHRSAASTGGSVQSGRDLYDDSKKKTTRKE